MKRRLSLFLAAALLAACGSDDGGDDERVETTPPTPELARFESNRIAFTFEYPEDFAAETHPRKEILARVGVKRGERLNAIQVRRTARRELEPERYLDEFKRDLEGTVRTVETHEERIGDLEVGALEVETADFTSSSYFFPGAGQTWQVECSADSEHREEIEAACRTALESVEFAR